MTSKQTERYGKQLAARLKEIEREGRRCQDELVKSKLRVQYAGVRDALKALRPVYVASVELGR